MADKKITALTDLSTGIASADLLHVVDDPTGTPINKKISVANFINNLPTFIGFSNSIQDMADNSVTAANSTTAVTKLETTGTVATTLADGNQTNVFQKKTLHKRCAKYFFNNINTNSLKHFSKQHFTMHV